MARSWLGASGERLREPSRTRGFALALFANGPIELKRMARRNCWRKLVEAEVVCKSGGFAPSREIGARFDAQNGLDRAVNRDCRRAGRCLLIDGQEARQFPLHP